MKEEKQVKANVEEILEEARVRQQQESGRRGKSEGGSEGEDHGQQSEDARPVTSVRCDRDR